MTDAPAIDVEAIPEDEGLLFACVLDGRGGARLTGWEEVEGAPETDGLWVHLERADPRAQAWLRQRAGLTPVTIEALLAEETRPRTFRGKRGTIAILRGVNTNPGADPEDMVAIRLWCDGHRLISIRQRRLRTPRVALQALVEGIGAASVPALFERLISGLIERLGGVIEQLDDDLDAIEEEVGEGDPSDLRARLGDLRQEAVRLRRYMAPQRDAVALLWQEPPEWLDETSRLRLREAGDRLMQQVEALDAARERAVVLKDDVANQVAERMNRNTYILSIVAAIFLPLGFVTGLLGINVGGMPGMENGAAFWITCAGIVVMLLVQLVIFRKLRWI